MYDSFIPFEPYHSLLHRTDELEDVSEDNYEGEYNKLVSDVEEAYSTGKLSTSQYDHLCRILDIE